MNLKIVFTFLLISSYALTAADGGCVMYDWNLKTRCVMCFNSKPNEDSKCVEKAADDKCVLRWTAGHCALCEAGYAVDTTLEEGQSMIDYKCVQAEAPANCVNPEVNNGKVTCKACKNGFYPNFELTACDSESGLENCLWAARFYQGNQATCWRCNEGYVTDKTGKCVEEKDLVGCLSSSDGTTCSACDIWDGYYMESYGKCSK